MATLLASRLLDDDSATSATLYEDCQMTAALNSSHETAATAPPCQLTSNGSPLAGSSNQTEGRSSSPSSHDPPMPLLLLPPPAPSSGIEEEEGEEDELPELRNEEREDDASSSLSSSPAATAATTEAKASGADGIDAAMDEVLETQERGEAVAADKEVEGDDEDLYGDNLSSSLVVKKGLHRHHGGGLLNLGNTCYMASALQMLATLDGFLDRLRDAAEAPAETGDENDGNSYNEGQQSLRKALLDLVRRLQNGETVSPHAFKRVVDDKSPLFHGYRQQDAHEFLTTLLDLIDENYKRKPRSGSASDDKAVADDKEAAHEMDVFADEEQQVAEDQPVDTASSLRSDHSTELSTETESSRKKPRTEELQGAEPMEEDGGEAEEREALEESSDAPAVVESFSESSSPASPSSLTTSACRSSFSDLNLDEIEQLLHDTPSSLSSCAYPSSSDVSMTYQPRCKLVGGRMNPADVVLTPYASAVGVTDDAPSVASGSPDDSTVSSNAPHATPSSDDPDAAPDAAAVAPSPVDEAFQLRTRVRLTCDSCKYSRTHTESFLHLSLEIGPGCCASVDDGLRRFFAPERRDIKCDKCFGESATQSTEITRLPPVLLLHLKRFIVEVSESDYSYGSVSYRKDQSTVLYDPRLELDDSAGGVLGEFVAPDCLPSGPDRSSKSYRLRSVVNHMGLSASCGHYTADAHRRAVVSSTSGGPSQTSGKRRWTRFNDSTVTPITAEQALEDSRRTAYLVAYELDDGDDNDDGDMDSAV